ncbi:MAG: serine protease [Verrucomicrobia bacterium]|nr:serine protease [Verrucomicrobiota bacterium]
MNFETRFHLIRVYSGMLKLAGPAWAINQKRSNCFMKIWCRLPARRFVRHSAARWTGQGCPIIRQAESRPYILAHALFAGFFLAVLAQADDKLAAPQHSFLALAQAEPISPKEPPAKEPPPLQELTVPKKPLPGKTERLTGVFRKDSPTSIEDLKSIERQVKKLLDRVSPAVVAVRVGLGSGSGVVISEDGLVLTAAHVCVRPGLDVSFIFPDGKTAKGKTLGTNHEIDAGLMRIADEGQWPHVEISDPDQARLGDWVLALGHPGGFDPYRPLVVRLGRIIRLAQNALQTDCTLIAGDSGGPLFDMHGRVVGIHSRISDSTAANFHVPIATYSETWGRLAKGESWGDGRPPAQSWVGAWGVDHPEGFRVELVNQGGPGERAGLQVGDLVTSINGKEIKGFDAFAKHVSRVKLGEKVTLAIKRGESAMTLEVTVEDRPSGLR